MFGSANNARVAESRFVRPIVLVQQALLGGAKSMSELVPSLDRNPLTLLEDRSMVPWPSTIALLAEGVSSLCEFAFGTREVSFGTRDAVCAV